MVSTSAAYSAAPPAEAAGEGVSLFRLYLLRGTYLLIAVGLGSEIWPLVFHHRPWEVMHSVAVCMLAAVTALAVLGIRYPLKMLPLLFLEMFWKGLFLIAIAYPAWQAQTIDANLSETIFACAMGIIFPVLIPWRYVVATYVKARSDRWW